MQIWTNDPADEMSKQGSGRHYCRADEKVGTFMLGMLWPCVWYYLGAAIDISNTQPPYVKLTICSDHSSLNYFDASRLYRLIKIAKHTMSTREMVSDSSHSSTHTPSTETLYDDFRVLEQECKKLEKRAVRAEGKARKTQESLNRMTLMYRQAQSKTQNTEESFNQLMHMHRWALACLENAEESIDGLKDDLNDARNGDWYFWDFVNELRCGICNKDLDGAYRIPASPAEIPSTALAYGSGSKRLYEGPIYNRKVVNLLQMLGSEEERPASYDWEVFFPSLSS
ncbi:hypothetical protein IW262DRAFT_1295895 [Armillaria fumosa]|nr:hypothetical protein IW262DRAFT_1295895 [Armillaria fumosa]